MGYLLFTAKGYKYWADGGAIKWLEAATNMGHTPETCSFMVRHEKKEGKSPFSYGFRYKEAMDIEQESEEMEEEEEEEGLKTPKLDD